MRVWGDVDEGDRAVESGWAAGQVVVARRAHTFLIMNGYPYAVGHLMAVPYRKVADLAELTTEERLELWELAELSQRIQNEVFGENGKGSGRATGIV